MNIMDSKKIITCITVAVILLFTGVIIGWHLYTPRTDFEIQAPGADNRPEGGARSIYDVQIGEHFMKYADVEPSSLTGKWTQFRGEKSDNIIVTAENINFSGSDYPILWTIETGEGYAAPVIYNGRAYFLDYVEALSSDALRCLDLETGAEIWRRWYRSPMRRNHGFSRTVPVIGEGYIITIGPMGHVMCCDPETGDLLWAIDMQKDFGTTIPQWHSGQCPLVDDGILVLAPAGEEILLAGLDCLTGEILWSTPNTINYDKSHSSIMPMTIAGKRTYVYIGLGGVCGVSADKDDIGTLLWHVSTWRPSTAAVPSPVQIAQNRIFLCAGYGVGGALLEVNRQGERWNAAITQQYNPRDGISCEQHTPIFYNNMLISVLPKSGGPMRSRVVCYSPTNLNNPLWISEGDETIVDGPYIVINNHLFAFSETAELFVYEILQQSMRLLKRQKIMDGSDAFGPLSYADGILVLGDDHTLMALKISD